MLIADAGSRPSGPQASESQIWTLDCNTLMFSATWTDVDLCSSRLFLSVFVDYIAPLPLLAQCSPATIFYNDECLGLSGDLNAYNYYNEPPGVDAYAVVLSFSQFHSPSRALKPIYRH
jgi:hypothetical protein